MPFSALGVKIVIVIDGISNPLKNSTSIIRQEQSKKAKDDLNNFINSAGNYVETTMVGLLKKAVYPKLQFFAALYKWGGERGVSIYCAPFEADWNLAYMCHDKNIKVDYIISKDSDIAMLGRSSSFIMPVSVIVS